MEQAFPLLHTEPGICAAAYLFRQSGAFSGILLECQRRKHGSGLHGRAGAWEKHEHSQEHFGRHLKSSDRTVTDWCASTGKMHAIQAEGQHEPCLPYRGGEHLPPRAYLSHFPHLPEESSFTVSKLPQACLRWRWAHLVLPLPNTLLADSRRGGRKGTLCDFVLAGHDMEALCTCIQRGRRQLHPISSDSLEELNGVRISSPTTTK